MGACTSVGCGGEEYPTGFPVDAFAEKGTFRRFSNWSVDPNFNCPNIFYQPVQSEGELLTLLNWAKDNQFRVRPTGAQHNWSPLTIAPHTEEYPNVILTDMRIHFNKVLYIQNSTPPFYVTAQPGVMISDFLEELANADGRGLSLPHTPAINDVTLGGMLAINAHGTGISSPFEPADNFGTLSHRLIRIRAAVFNKATNKYEFKDFRRDAPLGSDEQRHFSALQCGIGRTFMVEFDMQCEEECYLRCQSYMNISWRIMFPAPEESIADTIAEAVARIGDVEKHKAAMYNIPPPPSGSMAAVLFACGRAEAIWFPFTENPWLKVWSRCPPEGPAAVPDNLRHLLMQAIGSTVDNARFSVRLDEPCPFHFTDNLPPSTTLGINLMLHVRNFSAASVAEFTSSLKEYKKEVASRAQVKRDLLDVAAAIKARNQLEDSADAPVDPVYNAIARSRKMGAVNQNDGIEVDESLPPMKLSELEALQRLKAMQAKSRAQRNADTPEDSGNVTPRNGASPGDELLSNASFASQSFTAMSFGETTFAGNRSFFANGNPSFALDESIGSMGGDTMREIGTDAKLSLKAVHMAARYDPRSTAVVGKHHEAPVTVIDLIGKFITTAGGGPEMTPYISRLTAAVSQHEMEKCKLLDLWGPAKNTSLYVKSNTLRVTANGYAVLMHRRNMQLGIYEFTRIYYEMLTAYQAKGRYPASMPLEIRVTGLDNPNGLHLHNSMVSGEDRPIVYTTDPAEGPHDGPVASALYMDDECRKYGYDVVLWIDVLSLPGTQYSSRFYHEMEAKILNSRVFQAPIALVRPEWSKGWGYTTKDGPWSSAAFADVARSRMGKWNEAVRAWDEMDPHHIFGNPHLDEFTKKYKGKKY